MFVKILIILLLIFFVVLHISYLIIASLKRTGTSSGTFIYQWAPIFAYSINDINIINDAQGNADEAWFLYINSLLFPISYMIEVLLIITVIICTREDTFLCLTPVKWKLVFLTLFLFGITISFLIGAFLLLIKQSAENNNDFYFTDLATANTYLDPHLVVGIENGNTYYWTLWSLYFAGMVMSLTSIILLFCFYFITKK